MKMEESFVKVTETQVIDLQREIKRVTTLLGDIEEYFYPETAEAAGPFLAYGYDHAKIYVELAHDLAQKLEAAIDGISHTFDSKEKKGKGGDQE